MSNDIAVKELYSSPVISAKIDISESTLRKYCQILEKSGWRFTKNERGARLFNEQDLDVLKMFIKVKEELGMSLDASSDMAVRYFQANDTLTHQESASIDNALTEKKQQNFLQEFRHTKEYFEDYFDKRLEKVYEGNDLVIDKLNQVLDDNEILIEAAKERDQLKKENEELKQRLQELEKKKPFFKKLFK